MLALLIFFLPFSLCLFFLYAGVMLSLFNTWADDPNYSHGFFIPIISLFLIWQRRRELIATPIEPEPWLGLAVVALALMLLIGGVIGAELFTARVSFIFLLVGLALHFLGRKQLRKLAFPLAFLLLMIPVPAIIFNQITFPLQLFASEVAATVLRAAGVPVLREGNIIHLPAVTLGIVEACSGIRSLAALFTLALVLSHLSGQPPWHRVAAVILSLPIAVIANAARVSGTGLLAHFANPRLADGFFHSFSGWLVFLVAAIMLIGANEMLSGISRWWARGGRFYAGC